MFTSDINKKQNRNPVGLLHKTVFTYMNVSVFCALITHIYAIFGHGIRSVFMDYMFLVPFLAGALFFYVLGKIGISKESIRPGYNIYNSAVAAITAACMLKGIVIIAGTESIYITLLFITGVIMLLLGITLILTGFIRSI